jgi:pimeloyl-ACP methyl ester carboxylesterase/DNA-binding CsgD family transcriptional regulator
MQPQIRYVESADGTRIAYSAIGSGPPLVITPVLPGTHLEMDWQLPDRQEWYTRLAQSFTVVRYDGRGAGLSQREVGDLSLESHVADLEAIVDKLGFEQFALLSRHLAAPIALTFAADNPERISRLVLWNAVYRVADYTNTKRQQALLTLLESDWELFTETTSYASQGWPETARARQFAAYTRASISQTMYRQYLLAFTDIDVSTVLARVSCPTLVFHRKEVAKFELAVSQKLAASLSNARLVLADGESTALFGEDLPNITETIEDFLQEMCQPSVATPDSRGDTLIAATNAPSNFTGREVEILRLVSSGKHNREIAGALGVSVHTVDRHLANIFSKIGAHNRVEAATFALTHGFAEPAST